MAVSVLDELWFYQDNNTNILVPSAGTDRYWIIGVAAEALTLSENTTITVTGVSSPSQDTTLDLIGLSIAGTMRIAIYGCKDADIGVPLTTNGSLNTIAGSSPSSGGVFSICFQGVDQTTPFTDVEDDGWSVDSTDSTENCPFTLDEVDGGYGFAVAGCSKVTGVTWTLAGSYAHLDGTDFVDTSSFTSPYNDGTSSSYAFAGKAITSTVSNVTTTFKTALTGDKTCTGAVMLLPAAAAGTTIPIFMNSYRQRRT